MMIKIQAIVTEMLRLDTSSLAEFNGIGVNLPRANGDGM